NNRPHLRPEWRPGAVQPAPRSSTGEPPCIGRILCRCRGLATPFAARLSMDQQALEWLKTIRRELLDPKIKEHRGRIVKTTGDGIEFRIGINLGDIIIDEGDIYGDGVNVAARLEALAEPGGICVSRVVRDQVRDKLDFTFDDQGEQQVKNITRPVRVYLIRPGEPPQPNVAGTTEAAAPPLPDKPSIAVLPFQNLSGDVEQEYFADGIVEDII